MRLRKNTWSLAWDSSTAASESLCNHQERHSGRSCQVVEACLRSSVDIFYNTDGPCSPQHSITDEECRKSVFNICELIAQKSDEGRQALVDADILPELSHLSSSQKAIEVVSACKILKALAYSGTFRNTIITAGLEKAMEDITRYDFGAFGSLTISDILR